MDKGRGWLHYINRQVICRKICNNNCSSSDIFDIMKHWQKSQPFLKLIKCKKSRTTILKHSAPVPIKPAAPVKLPTLKGKPRDLTSMFPEQPNSKLATLHQRQYDNGLPSHKSWRLDWWLQGSRSWSKTNWVKTSLRQSFHQGSSMSRLEKDDGSRAAGVWEK